MAITKAERDKERIARGNRVKNATMIGGALGASLMGGTIGMDPDVQTSDKIKQILKGAGKGGMAGFTGAASYNVLKAGRDRKKK